jgi:hypothetical protein
VRVSHRVCGREQSAEYGQDLQIAVACRTVEDRANVLGELCRTGPVGAGVLLGR